MTYSTYSFTISAREKFDFSRVCRETLLDNPERVGFLVIGPHNATLTLTQKFLGSFDSADQIFVGGEQLRSQWGYRYEGMMDGDHLFFVAIGNPEGFRTKTLSKDSVPKIIEEVKAAKAFVRAIPVKVLVF